VPAYDICGWFVLLFFFFSSRRRHTRFSRDWSSDVCSSDLRVIFGAWTNWTTQGSASPDPAPTTNTTYDLIGFPTRRLLTGQLDRSEEHTSELQSRENIICRLLLDKKKAERLLRTDFGTVTP